VNELKDKAPTVMAMGAAVNTVSAPTDAVIDDEPVSVPTPVATPRPAQTANTQSEALSALSNLGYSPSEAASAVAQAAGDAPEASTADLIRTALRLLAPKG
jgi:Holliday junction DNA helicase RuvA